MAIRDALLAEFDHEMIITRQTLERVPEGKPDWAPHEKSMKMGRLAGHLAELSGWSATIINQDELDFRPAGAPPTPPLVMTSRQQLLDTFDKKVAEARAALSGASDEHLLKSWKLLGGGQTIMEMPRGAFLRSFVMNHVIHHRAQLGVYLRMNNVPVPSVYGPSARACGMKRSAFLLACWPLYMGAFLGYSAMPLAAIIARSLRSPGLGETTLIIFSPTAPAPRPSPATSAPYSSSFR